MTVNRAELVRRMQAEIQASRERMMVQLAREYQPTAKRLLAAYADVLPGLNEAINSSRKDGFTTRSMEKLQGRIAREMTVLQRTIFEDAAKLEASGAATGYQAGVVNLNAGGMGVGFNRPTLDSIAASVNYVDSPAFEAAVNRLGDYHGGEVANLILTAQSQGLNPTRTARMISAYFNTSQMPMIDAERMTRTTQIYAARTGTQAIYQRTGVTEWIWSANLGSPRTCLACIAMHGTVHPSTEVLNDHHNGRCAAVPKTPTWAALGFDSGGEPTFETGVRWFERQDEAAQRAAMGPQLFEAYQAGRFTFTPETVVGVYTNDIFGQMRHRKTNADILAMSA